VPADKRGLPDSRVARGVEDSVIEIKRQLFRFGRFGRLAFYSNVVVILGAVCPWYFVHHQGYAPGVEGWGALPLGLSLVCIAMLVWRHRPQPRARVLPVMLHLVLAGALVLVMLWRYQVARDTSPHLRPDLAFGYYVSAVGALGAFLGALIGLKDVR
jgi:O-antigen/teichoic acid export membrane protein